MTGNRPAPKGSETLSSPPHPPLDMGVDLASGPDRTLWIVGQNRDASGKHWEFQGVFDSEEKAIAACRNDAYWIAPAILNEPIPDETLDGWPGLRFPDRAEQSSPKPDSPRLMIQAKRRLSCEGNARLRESFRLAVESGKPLVIDEAVTLFQLIPAQWKPIELNPLETKPYEPQHEPCAIKRLIRFICRGSSQREPKPPRGGADS